MTDLLDLRAGPLSLGFNATDGFIRYLSYGSHEFLRGVYAAVRDRNWGTVPPRIKLLSQSVKADSFAVAFETVCEQGDIHFVWQGAITGHADGRIHYRFKGEAQSTFLSNRIGFCVLHPPALAGRECVVESVSGECTQGKFPEAIAPHQPFLNLRAITHKVCPGVSIEVRMLGDTFEMEDQRNWTDASYKTYCTPLALPFPATINKGAIIEQQIVITAQVAPEGRRKIASPGIQKRRRAHVYLTPGDRPFTLPAIGTVWNGSSTLQPAEWSELAALRLSHLRLDVRFSRPDWHAEFITGVKASKHLGTALEIVLHVSDGAEREVGELIDALKALHPRPAVARWIVLHQNERCCTGQWLKGVAPFIRKARLGGLIGSGTDAYFTEFNRGRPPAEGMDFGCYSINPQVHAFDDRSLTETLAMQGVTVQNASALIAGKPIAVTPVSLRPRFNPNATAGDSSTPAGELPADVDSRQATAFGAVWTLGSLKSLGEAGALSATYYNALGWTGLMEHPHGNSAPARFPSQPGALFPLFHVLAWAGLHRGATGLSCQSSHPLVSEALVVKTNEGFEALLGNYTDEPRMVTLKLPTDSTRILTQILDFSKSPNASSMTDCLDQIPWEQHLAKQGQLTLTLPAHALARCGW
ncbi:MAG: hypothetical protein SFY80_17435 [Verrucomicrobiota bacterium]|nr:hypothetical protein [Verrucomicrobiota bacterium]